MEAQDGKSETLRIRVSKDFKERLHRLARTKDSDLSHEARQCLREWADREEREAAAAEESEVAA